MSNEVKRLWIKNEDGLVDVFNVRKHVLDYKPEGFDEKTPLGPRYIEVMRVEDHDRLMKEKDAQIDSLRTVLEAVRSQMCWERDRDQLTIGMASLHDDVTKALEKGEA